LKPRNPISNPRLYDYPYLFHRQLISDLKNILPLSGKIYLDIGAGNQPFRLLYEKDRTIFALDPSPNLSGKYIRGLADTLPIASQSCDVVLMFASLGCVDNPVNTFNEIWRILRPGGLALISEHQSWHQYGQFDRYHFTKNGFEHLGKTAGFKLKLIQSQGSFWMRVGICLNRMILPYQSSRWHFLAGFLKPLVVLNNCFFGLLDHLWKLDGEAVNWIALFEKPGEC